MWRNFERREDSWVFNFYSHIPCGMWQIPLCLPEWRKKFLLTHPVWDVTMCRRIQRQQRKFLLTHPVWDVTSSYSAKTQSSAFLLTHPVWDVTFRLVFCCYCHIFLLTHPVWDVTFLLAQVAAFCLISTHTSRVGCDLAAKQTATLLTYFYSHIPCGMWRDIIDNQNNNANFYSHIPCGMWRKSAESTTAQSWFLLTHPVWDVTVFKQNCIVSF